MLHLCFAAGKISTRDVAQGLATSKIHCQGIHIIPDWDPCFQCFVSSFFHICFPISFPMFAHFFHIFSSLFPHLVHIFSISFPYLFHIFSILSLIFPIFVPHLFNLFPHFFHIFSMAFPSLFQSGKQCAKATTASSTFAPSRTWTPRHRPRRPSPNWRRRPCGRMPSAPGPWRRLVWRWMGFHGDKLWFNGGEMVIYGGKMVSYWGKMVSYWAKMVIQWGKEVIYLDLNIQ